MPPHAASTETPPPFRKADSFSDITGAVVKDRVALPLLRDPGAYRPTTFSYSTGKLPLEKWIAVFRASTPSMEARAASSRQASGAVPEAFAEGELTDATGRLRPAVERAASFGARFERELQRYEAGEAGEADCLVLCEVRDKCLREAGFPDAFAAVKAEEDLKAMTLLPEVLEGLDVLAAAGDPAAHCEALLRGCFAGNVFDLGAKATVEMYEKGDMSFAATRDNLLPRPWVVDCMDAFKAKWASGGEVSPWRKAIVFVDNSGADCWLGMLPLCRALAVRGTEVVIAANHAPSLNDMTAAELKVALPRVPCETVQRLLGEGKLSVCDSGSDDPVIDLRRVSPELAEVARDADLVILEGMGRGIETNLETADLTCDRLSIGMVKHPEVAESLGGRLYDVVVKFVEAGG